MPDAAIVRVMSDFRRQVQSSEDVAMRIMARRWLDVERALESQIELVAREIADLRAAGKTVTRELILLLDHSQSMLLQTRDQVGRFAGFADDLITGRQRELANLGVEHAATSIQTVAANVQFSRLNIAAVENVIGLAGNGSPLRLVLANSYGAGAEGILDILVRGVAMGKNPRDMAKQAVRNGLSQSLNHMMVTMRSETLRVYRHTVLETYKASGIVHGYKRIASQSKRTCLGCLASDGQFFALDVPFAEHVQGRCSAVPAIIGVPEPTWKTGAEWFEEQPAEVQREMMGPGRYDVWKKGDVPFREFATTREDATWGNSIVVTPLRELPR